MTFLDFKTYRFSAPRQQERSLHRIPHEIPPINASINYVARVGERALKARGRDTLLCLPMPLSFLAASAAFFLFPRDFRVPPRGGKRVIRSFGVTYSMARADVDAGKSWKYSESRINSQYHKVFRRMYRYERICVRKYTAQKLERKSGHVEIFS